MLMQRGIRHVGRGARQAVCGWRVHQLQLPSRRTRLPSQRRWSGSIPADWVHAQVVHTITFSHFATLSHIKRHTHEAKRQLLHTRSRGGARYMLGSMCQTPTTYRGHANNPECQVYANPTQRADARTNTKRAPLKTSDVAGHDRSEQVVA